MKVRAKKKAGDGTKKRKSATIHGSPSESVKGTSRAFASLQKKIGYEFKDVTLLRQALTHPSYQAEASGDTPANNQRLEFLGDSVLGLVLSERLFQCFPNLREGELSRYRSNLVKGSALSGLARQLDLGRHLYLGRGEIDTGGRDRDKLLEDGVEALLGAVFLDGGFDAARSVALRWYSDLEARLEEVEGADNPKGRLQEAIQAEHPGEGPEYRVVSEQGPSHQRTFEVEVRFREKSLGRGTGASKKAAEARAAACAVNRWGEASAKVL